MNNNKTGMSVWLVVVGILCACIAVVCLVIFLLHGETTTTGGYNEGGAQESLTCTSNEVPYPLFEYDESTGKKMEITALFKDGDLDSISLVYKLDYEDEEKVKKSEAINHVALNNSFHDNGLEADALNATYSKLSDGMQLSLYAEGSNLNAKTLKYFLLKNMFNKPYSRDKITKTYTSQGLNCEARN